MVNHIEAGFNVMKCTNEIGYPLTSFCYKAMYTIGGFVCYSDMRDMELLPG